MLLDRLFPHFPPNRRARRASSKGGDRHRLTYTHHKPTTPLNTWGISVIESGEHSVIPTGRRGFGPLRKGSGRPDPVRHVRTPSPRHIWSERRLADTLEVPARIDKRTLTAATAIHQSQLERSERLEGPQVLLAEAVNYPTPLDPPLDVAAAPVKSLDLVHLRIPGELHVHIEPPAADHDRRCAVVARLAHHPIL